MSDQNGYALFTFESTHSAIEASRLLSPMGGAVVPTLREISASCGMSIRLAEEKKEAATSLLCVSGIEGWRLYIVSHMGSAPVCCEVCRG